MEDVHRNNRKETVQTENIKNAPTEKVAPKKSAKQIKKKTFLSLVNWKWVITAFLSSLVISIILSLLSSHVSTMSLAEEKHLHQYQLQL